MIRHLFIVLLLIFFCSGEQKSIDLANKSKGTFTVLRFDKVASGHNVSDTIFISRKVTKNSYHTIYIDTTRQSEYHKWLTDFVFDKEADKYSREYYGDAYKNIKSKNPNKFKSKKLKDVLEEWVPIYQYKDKYYLYKPCDGIFLGRVVINDSTLVFWGWDKTPASIQSIKREGDSKYVLEIATISDEKLSVAKLIIRALNKRTKLCVFEFTNEPEEYRYQLYIPVKSAKYFDVVINHCVGSKQMEYEFDKIDYQHLLKGLK